MRRGPDGQRPRVAERSCRYGSSSAQRGHSGGMDAFDLTGKTAFVTGAFGGLGLHFARVLAARGAKVALAGRRIELGRTVAAEIGAAVARPDDIRAYALDVTD